MYIAKYKGKQRNIPKTTLRDLLLSVMLLSFKLQAEIVISREGKSPKQRYVRKSAADCLVFT